MVLTTHFSCLQFQGFWAKRTRMWFILAFIYYVVLRWSVFYMKETHCLLTSAAYRFIRGFYAKKDQRNSIFLDQQGRKYRSTWVIRRFARWCPVKPLRDTHPFKPTHHLGRGDHRTDPRSVLKCKSTVHLPPVWSQANSNEAEHRGVDVIKQAKQLYLCVSQRYDILQRTKYNRISDKDKLDS